jgi:hypothetical protein
MNQNQLMLAIFEAARQGDVLPTDKAFSHLGTLIDHLDKRSPTYDEDRRTLLSIGATIWELDRKCARLPVRGAADGAAPTESSTPLGFSPQA